MLSIKEKLKFCEKVQGKVYRTTGRFLPVDDFLWALEFYAESTKITSLQLMILGKLICRRNGTKSNPLRFNDVAKRIKK